MRSINISDEAFAKKESGEFNSTIEAAAAIRAELQAPLELAGLVAVNYDSKTDRYTATFEGSGKKAVLKVDNHVAAFWTENLHKSGSWQGRMHAGVLIDVYRIYV